MKFKKPKPIGSHFAQACAELIQAREDAFQLYVGPMRTPSHLFHFSSVASIKAILQTGTIWASDVRLMKDKTELEYATRLLREVVMRPGHYLENVHTALATELLDQCIHIACLTMEASLRNQWMDYGDRGRGCAISFDFHRVRALDRIGSFPLAYDPEIQQQIFETYLGRAQEIAIRYRPPRAFRRQVLRDVAAFLFSIKNPLHAAEREWRLQTNHADPYKLNRRPDGGCCSELPICAPESVCGILLGPDCPLTVAEAEDFLGASGYATTGVFKLAASDLT